MPVDYMENMSEEVQTKFRTVSAVKVSAKGLDTGISRSRGWVEVVEIFNMSRFERVLGVWS